MEQTILTFKERPPMEWSILLLFCFVLLHGPTYRRIVLLLPLRRTCSNSLSVQEIRITRRAHPFAELPHTN